MQGHGDLLSEARPAEVADVAAVDFDATLVGIVESQEQAHEGSFPRACGPHDGNHLAGIHTHVHILEYLAILFIAETNIAVANGVLNTLERNRIDRFFHFGFEIEDFEETARTAMAAGATQAPEDVPQDGRFAEGFIRDPVGQRVDLSVRGWLTKSVG